MRGIAVLGVVAFHAGLPLPGGFTGVDIFFVISGYVITGQLLREIDSSGSIRLRRFFTGRFRRLGPALGVMVAVTLVISFFTLSPLGALQNTVLTGIGSVIGLANLVIDQTSGNYFDTAAENNALLNAWSLSVEEQFYLLFPVILVVSLMVFRILDCRNRNLFFACIIFVGALLSFWAATAGASSLLGGPESFLVGFYGPLGRAWEFSIGALLALIPPRFLQQPGFLFSSILGCIGLLGITFTWLALTVKSGDVLGPQLLVPTMSTAALIIAGFNAGNPITKVLGTRPLVYVGNISYSLYLWHWPLIVITHQLWPGNSALAGLVAIASVIPAIASYVLVEQRWRYQKDLSRLDIGRIVLVAIVTPLAIGFGILLSLHTLLYERVSALTMSLESHPMMILSCFPRDFADSASARRCALNETAAGKPIYLVGDSTADALSTGVVGASLELDRPLQLVGMPGCPFSEIVRRYPRSFLAYCEGQYVDAMAWLDQQVPGLVMLSNLNNHYRERDPALIETDWLGKLDASLLSTVQGLQNSGHSVLIVQAPPDFRAGSAPTIEACNVSSLLLNSCISPSSRRDELDAFQKLERTSINRVAALSGASILDLRSAFCVRESCSWSRDGDFLYRDAFHLSVQGSKRLLPDLQAAIQSVSIE